jgi:hypothetical protein
VGPGESKPVLVTEQEAVGLEASVVAKESTFSAWVTNLPVTSRHKSTDKVFYKKSNGKRELSFSTKIPLTEGANLVTVVAKGADGLESRESLMVRRK